MGYSNYRRVINERVYDFKYEKIKTIGDRCIYCGAAPHVWDHVPPIVVASNYGGKFIKVPACKECNAFLNHFNVMDLESRRRHIIGRILVRRKSALNTPKWEDCELGEIKGWVNGYIRSEIKRKKSLINRMEYMVHNISETFGHHVDDYQLIKRGIPGMVQINDRFSFERNSECWILNESMPPGINPQTKMVGEKKRYRQRYYPTLNQLLMATADISLDTAQSLGELKDQLEKIGKEIVSALQEMHEES
jgi:hypothetical protein